MRFTFAALGLAAALATTVFAAPAQARIAAPTVAVPNHVEQVACRIVRDRVVRPNGRVVTTTRRVCRPGFVVGPRRGCRVVKQRTVRPNGTVVVRSVRRC